MFDDSLSIAEMKFLVALCEVFDAHGGGPLNFDEVTEQLKDRGFAVGNGLSRELDDLEIKLGGQQARGMLLVDRRKGGSILRPRALELFVQFRKLLEDLAEIQNDQEGIRPAVAIGMTNSLTTHLLPRVLQESGFFTKYPNADVTIVEGEPHELVSMLTSRVDFALGPRDASNGCRSEFLCEWRRVLLHNTTVRYRNPFSPSVGVDRLREWMRDETLLVPARRIIPELDGFLKPMRKGNKIVLPQAAVRRSWVQEGLGIAIAHEEKLGAAPPASDIGSIDLSSQLGTTQMYFFFRKTPSLSPAAQFLVDVIGRTYGRNEAGRTKKPERGI